MRLIPFSEILPHSFTKDNLAPAEDLQSATILTPHGAEPEVYSYDDEDYEPDLDEDFDEEYEDLDEEYDEDQDDEYEDVEEDENPEAASEEASEGEYLDLSPKTTVGSEPVVFEFDDAENLHELEDRWDN